MFKLVVWFEFEFGINGHQFGLIFCRLQNFHGTGIRNKTSGFNSFLNAEDGKDERF